VKKPVNMGRAYFSHHFVPSFFDSRFIVWMAHCLLSTAYLTE